MPEHGFSKLVILVALSEVGVIVGRCSVRDLDVVRPLHKSVAGDLVHVAAALDPFSLEIRLRNRWWRSNAAFLALVAGSRSSATFIFEKSTRASRRFSEA